MLQSHTRIPGVIKTIKSLSDIDKRLDSLVKKEIKIMNQYRFPYLQHHRKLLLFLHLFLLFFSNLNSATLRYNLKTPADAGQAFSAQSAVRRAEERKSCY